MSAAQTPPPRCLQQSPDLVTQAQEQARWPWLPRPA
jgi:hypothetical protein